MAAFSTIALIGGLVLGAAGTGVQFAASQQAAEAQQESIQAQKRAEAARHGQLSLEAQRRKREIVRQGILARASATSTATNQGAQFGSTLPGALSGITGQAASGYQATQASERLGSEIFSANIANLNAQQNLAQAQSLSAVGQGLGSLGGALTKNLGPIGRLTYGLSF